jgi:tRNA modification GTPase
MLILGDIIEFESGRVIDSCLAVFMPAPGSFTGEDVVEFQLHGSPILVSAVLRSLYSYGIQPAVAGEFTRRAFLNGKLDLAQAEAIADLIHAKGEEAAKYANEQLNGRLSRAIDRIGEPLRDALAELEAAIDFPDEEIDPESIDSVARCVVVALRQVESLIATYSFGSLVRDGVRVLLCGLPNSGKSSLLNALLGKRRAIVSDISGTTRDLIEDEATFSGHRFLFCDSAGIRETEDRVEMIGVELAKERIPWADLVLLVVDFGDSDEAWRELARLLLDQNKRVWLVVNKMDLASDSFRELNVGSSLFQRSFFLSVKTGEGLGSLIDALVDDVAKEIPDKAEVGEVITNARHRECLERARRVLEGFSDCEQLRFKPLSIIATDLKACLNALDEIVGRTYTEDILGRIFSKFCIGK